jgi:hypothetical protein
MKSHVLFQKDLVASGAQLGFDFQSDEEFQFAFGEDEKAKKKAEKNQKKYFG